MVSAGRAHIADPEKFISATPDANIACLISTHSDLSTGMLAYERGEQCFNVQPIQEVSTFPRVSSASP